MRYAIVIPDGAADEPHPDLGNRTAFETASLPCLHRLASEGRVGMAVTIPPGMKAASDIANLSVLGYDPATYYTGRAPLEAAARGIRLAPGEAVFRVNTVTIENGRMISYAAGHIETSEACDIIAALDRDLGLPGIRLYAGISYRHLAVMADMANTIPERVGPHEIPGAAVAEYAAAGPGADRILEVEEKAAVLLSAYESNRQRIARGLLPVTHLWLWGGGVMPTLPSFRERFGFSGGLISAVDLLKGIAVLIGLDAISVPGATGYYDTNYAGKGQAALACLAANRFAAVHIEATDEAGHNGHAAEKVRALENIDRHILSPLAAEADRSGDLRILYMPDHPTPLRVRNHTADPVPFVMWGAGIKSKGAPRFTEAEIAKRSGPAVPAADLLRRMIAE